jgi:protein O-mannosyl-transferase
MLASVVLTPPQTKGTSGYPPGTAICVAAIAAATTAAYARTLSVPFLYDDYDCIVSNATLRHLGSALRPPISSTVGGRPVLNVSLAINYAVSGTAVWGYHAVNLAIHVLAGLTLFGIVRRALSSRSNPSATLMAFSATLIWVLHPLQTESVTYVVQRAESLMGLLYLLTLYLFIRGAEKSGSGAGWFGLSFCACLLGMATKEVMVSAPLVVLLYDRTFIAGKFAEALHKRWRVYLGLASTWIILGLLVFSTHGRGGTAGTASGISSWDYARTQLPAIVHYLRLCFLPHPLVFDYGNALNLDTSTVLPCGILIFGILAATLWALIRQPAAGFLGAWFFAVLAPSSSFVPVSTETMAEHRMYLPLAAVALLAVTVLYRFLGRAALPVCAAIAAVLAVVTWQRNETYRSAEGIWRDTVTHRPGNERAHNDLGYVLSSNPDDLNEAIFQYREALRLKPDYAEAHYNLGTALELVPGHLDEAISQYEEVLRLVPDFAEAHSNLGIALDAKPGRSADAIAQYEEAIRIKPEYAPAHFNLGCSLQRIPGRMDEAIAQYRETIRLMPDHVEAHSNLGTALFSEGRIPEAAAQYEEALSQRPDDAAIHLNLAYALLRIPGRSDDAASQLREVLRLQPDNGTASRLLAQLGALGK